LTAANFVSFSPGKLRENMLMGVFHLRARDLGVSFCDVHCVVCTCNVGGYERGY